MTPILVRLATALLIGAAGALVGLLGSFVAISLGLTLVGELHSPHVWQGVRQLSLTIASITGAVLFVWALHRV